MNNEFVCVSIVSNEHSWIGDDFVITRQEAREFSREGYSKKETEVSRAVGTFSYTGWLRYGGGSIDFVEATELEVNRGEVRHYGEPVELV
jgi:hypothetical protein